MNKYIFPLPLIIFLLMSPLLVLSQKPGPAVVNPPVPFNVIFLNFSNVVLATLWIVAIAFVIIMFTLAGFKYLTAKGNPQQIEEANKAVIWGVVGSTVIVLAWSAIAIIRFELGV